MCSFNYGLILHQRSLKKYSQYFRLLCFFPYKSNYPRAVAGTCPLNFCQHCVTVTLNDSMTVSAYFKDGAVKKDVPLWRHFVLCSLVTPTDIINVNFALISEKLCYILWEIQFPCKIWDTGHCMTHSTQSLRPFWLHNFWFLLVPTSSISKERCPEWTPSGFTALPEPHRFLW